MRHLRLIAPERAILARDIDFNFRSQPDTTTLQAYSGDMLLDFSARGGLEQIGKKGAEFGESRASSVEASTHRSACFEKALAQYVPPHGGSSQ